MTMPDNKRTAIGDWGLEVSEPSERHRGPILLHDADNNDVAEFFHCEEATVQQSYEQALYLARWTAVVPDVSGVLRDAYTALAFAFHRLESSARSRDGELCRDFQKVRAKIEGVLKQAGERL